MIETKFKHTDIGLIPEDWEVNNLTSIGNFFRGRGVVRKDSQSGFLPAIRYGEIYTFHDNYIKSFISHISEEVAKESFKIITGDICFAGYGETLQEIGKAVAYSLKGEAYAGQNTIILRPKTKISSLFFGFLLNQPYVAQQKANRGNGSSIMLITPQALSEVVVGFPKNVEEQERIGRALSDVDKLIDGLCKLVEKKRAIKKGAMEQLLSGKIRLPGFSEPWITTELHIISDYSSISLPADFFEDSDYVCTENMLSNLGGRADFEDIVCSHMVKSYVPYDILLSNIRPYLKKLWFADRSGGCSADVLIIRPNHDLVNGKFLYYLISQDSFFDYVMEGVSGTKMPRGNKKHIMGFSLKYPVNIKEQEAIANVLTDMDKEISALESKLEKYKQVKQGMMQQLLTGKIRLI